MHAWEMKAVESIYFPGASCQKIASYFEQKNREMQFRKAPPPEVGCFGEAEMPGFRSNAS